MRASLSRLVTNISYLHDKELVPDKDKLELRISKASLEIGRSQQLDFFNIGEGSRKSERYKVESARSQFIGYMYELLIASFYGGKLLKTPLRIGPEKFSLMPDVVDFERKIYWESKCISNGRRLPLRDDQSNGYNYLQKTKPYPKINFIIWKHSVNDIKINLKRSAEELLQEICSRTNYALVMPMSLIAEFNDLTKLEKHSSLVYRYVPKKEKPSGKRKLGRRDCVYVKNPVLYDLLISPEKVIEKLGLDPENYLFNRLKSPLNFYVNNYLLRPFPILEIIDKDHEAWSKSFDI